MTLNGLVRTALVATALLLATTSAQAQKKRVYAVDIVKETFGFTAESPSDFPWADIQQGCPARDCIPSIDKPKFVSADAAKFLEDDDLVLAINHKGVRRAYATRILNYHEIVNDTVSGDPIAITWCPLCGSGVAFHRVLDGEKVEFGVSGLLHNSDLILYDRDSNSLWQQITARAFAGPRRGQSLSAIPLTMTTWREWRDKHPDTQVLSTDTGGDADYGVAPYADYESSERVMFPVSAHDPRLHPKTVVHAVELGTASFAVTERALKAAGTIETKVGRTPVRWVRDADGTVQVTRLDTKQALVPTRVFWFAWFTFHPATGLHDTPPRKRSSSGK